MKETPSEIIAAARALLAELRRNEINPGSRYVRSLGFVVYYLREPPLKEFMARLEKALKTETPGRLDSHQALNRMVSCPHCGKPINAAAMLGSISTPAKARAARENAKKGGWPKGKPRKPKRVARRSNAPHE